MVKAVAASPLWFIRHGETDWNRQGRFIGTRDVALNARGRAQARNSAETLRQAVGEAGIAAGGVVFATSPLARARETTTAIRAALGLQGSSVLVDERLRELCFGRWEGMTTAEIKQTSNAIRRARKADRWTVAPPGGESYQARVPDISAFLDDTRPGMVVVAHSGTIRIVAHLLAGILPSDAARMVVPHEGVLAWLNGRLHWHTTAPGRASSAAQSGLSAPDDLG